jgi:signal peptidase I
MASPRPEDVAALVRSSAEDGVWLPVDGVSMLPTISAGSRVRVVSRARRPRIAEIWAFCDPTGVIVVHRYRRRDGSGRFVFRGDNVVQHDVPVDAEWLIGVVTRVEAAGTTQAVGAVARIRWLAGRLYRRIRR